MNLDFDFKINFDNIVVTVTDFKSLTSASKIFPKYRFFFNILHHIIHNDLFRLNRLEPLSTN